MGGVESSPAVVDSADPSQTTTDAIVTKEQAEASPAAAAVIEASNQESYFAPGRPKWRGKIASPAFYPMEWYDPRNYYWPVWVAAGANCVLGGYVCSKPFKSGIRHFPGRMVVAVALSVSAAVWSTQHNRRTWRRHKAYPDSIAARNMLMTSLVVGPLAGFLGGAAVSQPTDEIRYKGNPGYFASPVLRRYAGAPLCLGAGLAAGGLHWYASSLAMDRDLSWEEERKQRLRQNLLAKQRGDGADGGVMAT